ncbi:MAG: DedA family protein [Acetobacteraceae bacterium]|nr:DedA family protein [Acetobacteraceae bacterium]
MGDLIAQATDLVAQYPMLAILLAFAGAIIEAVAVLGILVPGTPILMAVAGVAAMAGLPMAPIMAVAILGAIVGDGISFWVGQRYSGRLRRIWPFQTRPHLLARAEAFFLRYGTMSVALCRFVPVLRSTVPLIAGMAGMRRNRFLIANISSAFVWAPAHVLPAQFAGLSIHRLQEGDWQGAAVLASVLLACAAGALWLHRTAKERRWGR